MNWGGGQSSRASGLEDNVLGLEHLYDRLYSKFCCLFEMDIPLKFYWKMLISFEIVFKLLVDSISSACHPGERQALQGARVLPNIFFHKSVFVSWICRPPVPKPKRVEETHFCLFNSIVNNAPSFWGIISIISSFFIHLCYFTISIILNI